MLAIKSCLSDSLNCYVSVRDIHFILHSDCKVLLYLTLLYLTVSECVSSWALNESCDPLLRVALLSLVHSCIDRLHSDRGNASWECFCDKSTSEHAPLNLYLVDPHALFLSLFLYYSLRQTSVWTQTIQSTCLAGWHQVESLSSVYFLLQVSLCVSVMCWDLSVGVTLVFVRLSCMFSLN